MDKKIQELIAIGASVTASCVPCFKFHFAKAREEGASDDDIREALRVALFVNIVVAFTHEATLSSPSSFSGFNQTDSGRSQFRISPDHRFGFALLAAA